MGFVGRVCEGRLGALQSEGSGMLGLERQMLLCPVAAATRVTGARATGRGEGCRVMSSV